MSEKKQRWGNKVLGWFVEKEEDEAGGAGAAPPAETEDAPEAPTPGEVQLKGDIPPPPEPGGGLDFAAVYRAAGISSEAQDRVDKAMTLLNDLPADAPQGVKRQIVEAALKAFGYPVEQIVQAGETEIRALEAFIELGERNTQKIAAESEARVEALTAEIAQIKQTMEQKLGAQRRLSEHCNAQRDRVREVLTFFGREQSDEPDAAQEAAAPEQPAEEEEAR